MNIEEQVELLMLGTEYGDEDLKKAMTAELRERLILAQKENRPLRVYCGYDPTSTDLHLGHTITMRKLRQFQDLGHDVTFLIGTYTGMLGDPSDKESVRRQQTLDEALQKGATYAKQAYRVLNRETIRIRYNHEWLQELSFGDVIGLASNFTVQQFLTRDNFAKRFERGDAIWLHEFFYALMQGYDAVAQETDVQIGGSDQLFNLMAGRKLMESFGQRPQVVLTFPILEGTDGVMRMSKSTGNYFTADELLDQHGFSPDQLRYYLSQLSLAKKQSNFELESLREKCAFLAGVMNASLEKPISAALSKFDGCVPEGQLMGKTAEETRKMVETYLRLMAKADYADLLGLVENYARLINKLFTNYKPHDDRFPEAERRDALYSSFFLLKTLMIMLYPFAPETMDRVRQALQLPPTVFAVEELGTPIAPGHRVGNLVEFFPSTRPSES